ncbi:MAG: bifunctional DNA primase/polymerase [Candidatus Woesearchaeota archaeon]
MNIPTQLQKPEFRFVLLKGKRPFESEWQKKGYRYDDKKLVEWIAAGGNYGVIGGYGNLRILDVDHLEVLDKFQLETFTVKSPGSQGRHFYFICPYSKNHVLPGVGELRANNYQVVGPGSSYDDPKRPEAKGKTYEVVNGAFIMEYSEEYLKNLIKPYIKDDATSTEANQEEPKSADKSRSGREFAEVCKLIKAGKTKEEVFEAMQAFAKWASAPPAYREKTYSKAQSKNESIVHPTTTTSHYITTSHYNIKSWGYFDPTSQLCVGQVSPRMFAGVIGGKKCLFLVKSEKDEESKFVNHFFEWEGQKYLFSHAPQKAPYNVPSMERVQEWLDGKLTIRPLSAILEDVARVISLLYDFNDVQDLSMCQLYVGQTYIAPVLDSFFYLGVDATRGSGKTTLLEILSFLAYHGFMGGDVSAAALARMCEDHSLSLLVDELDQKIGEHGEQEVVSILRKGQRRGNPYVRCEGKNHTPKAYDVAGPHGYSIRSLTEDALNQRTFFIHASVTTDSRLPVINTVKHQIIKPLADEMWFWALENLQRVFEEKQAWLPVVTCSGVVSCRGTPMDQRQALFDKLTSQFPEDDINLLRKLAGRNNEMAYTALCVSKLVGIRLSQLNSLMVAKQANESVSSDYYLEALQRKLVDVYENHSDQGEFKKGLDGIHPGAFAYPKNKMYEEYIMFLKSLNIMTIGSSRFHALLLDLGFIEGDTILNVRLPNYKYPIMGIIFDDRIKKRLGLISEITDQDVKTFIKERDKGDGVLTQAIIMFAKSRGCDEKLIVERLERMRTLGVVFNKGSFDKWGVV